ncbi:MAG TPA: DUF4340 domain-containing protein [Candidatus Bathyarchaeia archaeon]|nr:DUF4340 domain-containing protein [Candidatus Bathyarchaeia archaeon]
MKFRNTLILAVIVAAFGAYLYWVERPAAEKEAKKATLVEFDRDKVDSVQLKYTDTEIDLKKVDGKWRLTAPLATEADEPTVKNLIGAIADAEKKKVIDEKPGDLAPFGLDKPTAIVTLQLDGGQTIGPIAVGKTTPVGYSAYAKLADQPAVLLTTAAFQSGVKKEVKDLRDKTIIEFRDDDVQQITLSGGPEEIELHKDGADWQITRPAAARADGAQVTSFLAAMRSMRAVDFVDDAGAAADPKYGLATPRLSVDLLVGKDRAEKRLLVGGELSDASKKQMYVKRGERDTIYVVGDYAYTSLNKTAKDFRDKTIVRFDKDKPQSIVVTRADGKSFKLEKKDNAWTLADAGGAKVKDFIPARYVDDLHDLKGAEIASEAGNLKDFGLDHPALTIDVLGDGGAKLGRVLTASVGEGKDKKLYATAEGSPVIYSLRDYVYERVDKKHDDFVEQPTPAPAGSPAAGAAAVSAATPAQGEELEKEIPLPPSGAEEDQGGDQGGDSDDQDGD